MLSIGVPQVVLQLCTEECTRWHQCYCYTILYSHRFYWIPSAYTVISYVGKKYWWKSLIVAVPVLSQCLTGCCDDCNNHKQTPLLNSSCRPSIHEPSVIMQSSFIKATKACLEEYQLSLLQDLNEPSVYNTSCYWYNWLFDKWYFMQPFSLITNC